MLIFKEWWPLLNSGINDLGPWGAGWTGFRTPFDNRPSRPVAEAPGAAHGSGMNEMCRLCLGGSSLGQSVKDSVMGEVVDAYRIYGVPPDSFYAMDSLSSYRQLKTPCCFPALFQPWSN